MQKYLEKQGSEHHEVRVVFTQADFELTKFSSGRAIIEWLYPLLVINNSSNMQSTAVCLAHQQRTADRQCDVASVDRVLSLLPVQEQSNKVIHAALHR